MSECGRSLLPVGRPQSPRVACDHCREGRCACSVVTGCDGKLLRTRSLAISFLGQRHTLHGEGIFPAGERGPNRWASTRQQTPTARRKSGVWYTRTPFRPRYGGKEAPGAAAARLRESGYPQSPARRGPVGRKREDESVAQQGRQRMRPPPANPGRGCRKNPLGPAAPGHATRTQDDLS